MLSFFKKKKVLCFIGGLAAGLVLPSAAKSKTAHNASVCVVAKTMCLRDSARAACESIKEDAQDVYAEAKQQAAKGDGPDEEAVDAQA